MSNKNKNSNKASEKNTKKAAFGGYHWKVDQKGLDTTFREIIGAKSSETSVDVVPTELTKMIWEWARAMKYAAPKVEKKEVKVESLAEYWNNTIYEDQSEEQMIKWASKAGAKNKDIQAIKEAFKLKPQDKSSEEFEEDITEIVEELIKRTTKKE